MSFSDSQQQDDRWLHALLRGDDGPINRILDQVFDGVYVVNSERKILFWNRGAAKISGVSAQRVTGQFCYDNILQHTDEEGSPLCTGNCPLVHALSSGEHIRKKIFTTGSSGKRIPLLTHVAPIRDTAGKIRAAIEIFRDITTEEELRILSERFNRNIKKYVSSAAYESAFEQAFSSSRPPRLREVNIVYIDIVGFTSFAEKHSPTELIKMLNDFLGVCDVIIKEFRGDIDKFIGDAVMAVFNDADDAVGAGKQILTTLNYLNARVQSRDGTPTKVRIGVNSGQATEGDVGTFERKDRTIVGDVVNIAARVQTLAEPNSIMITEGTYARLSDPSDFTAQGSHKVRGREKPIELYLFRGGAKP